LRVCDRHDTLASQVALIDWLRQYDIIKKMERMGKSVGMIAGQVSTHASFLRPSGLALLPFCSVSFRESGGYIH